MISIIVPIYNSEKYLRKCIDSILKQTYKDFELILVNDGSSDNSLVICKGYNDHRIRIISTENSGVSNARNMGIDIAQGEYIAFVDSDDSLPENALLKLHKTMIEHNCDMVLGSYCLVYGNNCVPHSQRLKPGAYLFRNLHNIMIDDGTLSGFLIGSVWGTLYRTKIIRQHNILFNRNIKNNEDGLFNFEYALHAQTLFVIKDNVYYYHQYKNSSRSREKTSQVYNDQIYKYICSIIHDRNRYNIDNQFLKRNVSLALWDILSCSYPWKQGVNFIKERIRDPKVTQGIQEIEYQKLTFHKRVVFLLIKWHSYNMLYILVKHIIPFLNSKVPR